MCGARERKPRHLLLKFTAAFLLLWSTLWATTTLILPSVLLRGVLETRLSQALQTPVGIRAVTLHPFSLELKISGVRAVNPDGKGDLISLDELTITPSLHRQDKTVQLRIGLRVFRPVLNIAYLGGGRFSFSAPSTGEMESPSALGIPSFLVPDRLEVEEGTLVFRDEPLGITHTVSRIRITAPLVADRPGPQPELVGEFNGTRFRLEGAAVPQGKAVRTEFRIRSAPLEIRHFERYLTQYTPLRPTSGSIRLDMTFGLSLEPEGTVEADLTGTAAVSGVEVRDPGGAVIGRLGRGVFELRRFTLSERRINLSRVELSELYLRAGRDARGRIDWETWLEPALSSLSASGTAVPQAETSPLMVEGADLVLRDSSFTWSDAAWSDTGTVEITGVDGRIAEYSTRPGARTAMRLSFGINDKGMLALEGEGFFDPPALDAQVIVQDLPLEPVRLLLHGTPLADAAGRVDFRGRIQARGAQLTVEQGKAALRSVTVGRDGFGTTAFRMRRCDLDGLFFDRQQRSLRLNELVLKAPTLRLQTGSDGRFALPFPFSDRIFGETARSEKGGGSGGWTVHIGKTAIFEGRVERVRGRGTPDVLVSELHALVQPLSSDPRVPVRFDVRTVGTSEDTLRLEGVFRVESFLADMRVRARDLRLERAGALLRPLTDLAPAGRLEADLHVRLARPQSGTRLDTTLSGTATLREVTLRDAAADRLLGRVRRCTVERLHYDSRARIFSAAGVLLDRPRLSLTLEKNGRIDWMRIVLPRRNGDKVSAMQDRSGASSPSVLSAFAPDSLRIRNGSLRFRDERHSPPVTLLLTDFQASLGVPDRPAVGEPPSGAPATSVRQVRLAAQLDGAPVRISGTVTGMITPERMPSAMDLDISVADVDLRRCSPYILDLLGRSVEQGTLSVSTKLVCRGLDFRADNAVVLRNPVLGPGEARTSAPQYPLALGLSLLSGLDGDVTFDLPVWGKLDASDVRTGSLVGQAVGGLLTKILTSPLAIMSGLAGLAGKPVELRTVSFPSGQAVLTRRVREQAKEVAALLRANPRLQVRLMGQYEPRSDAVGIASRRLRRKILGRAHAALPPERRAATDIDALRLKPADYKHLLTQLYLETTGAAHPEETDVMERNLQKMYDVTGADLKYLAACRAEAMRLAVLESDPGVTERIKLLLDVRGRPQVKAGAARVELRLY